MSRSALLCNMGDDSQSTRMAGSKPSSALRTGYTGYHPDIRSAKPPSLAAGCAILVLSVVFFLVGSYSTLFSAFWPNTGITVLDVLAQDTHYKYFVLLLIPTTAYFVIANWVGWQYYRNS